MTQHVAMAAVTTGINLDITGVAPVNEYLMPALVKERYGGEPRDEPQWRRQC